MISADSLIHFKGGIYVENNFYKDYGNANEHN